MSSSNCCFLTCIQVSQEADQVLWYSRLFHNFPQFIVIHTVKGFGIVYNAEVDIFSFAFSMIQQILAIWSLVPLPFLNPAWTSGSSQFTYCWSLASALENFEHCFTSVWDECNCAVVWKFFGGDIEQYKNILIACGSINWYKHCEIKQVHILIPSIFLFYISGRIFCLGVSGDFCEADWKTIHLEIMSVTFKARSSGFQSNFQHF